ncbi:MAG TPA: response regulator [Fibrobacteria bacterium]|nr:response regulator [Fibrobacteria bacterium]
MRIKEKFRGKGNILLVERDPELRAFIGLTLTREGYAVFETEDGYQAFLLSETLAQPLHLLLAEVLVGEGLSGVELARHLQVLRPGLSVLYLSTIPANPDLRRELQAMLDSYLSKPFTGEDLVAKVGILMEKSRAKAKANGKGGLVEAGAAVNAWKSGYRKAQGREAKRDAPALSAAEARMQSAASGVKQATTLPASSQNLAWPSRIPSV